MEVEHSQNSKNTGTREGPGQKSIKLDLCRKQLNRLPENLSLQLSLTELYLSHNRLCEVSHVLLTLKNIKTLDLSYNELQYFDDTPSFCSQIQSLNLSNNKLKSPPYWVWTESPNNLEFLDLSYNPCLTHSFQDGYFEELLQYECLVTHVKINNCYIVNHLELLGTFVMIKELDIGTEELTNLKFANIVPEIPYRKLEKCSSIERLNASNTDVFLVNPSISLFKNLYELNLTQNRLCGLPNEFCELLNLEVVLLSYNNIMYLPDKFDKLNKLRILCIDGNEMCMLPNMANFPQLVKLDLYDNKLYDVPDSIENILEIDLAQNYFNEPSEDQYISRRNKLRINKENRFDGRKEEIERSDTPKSRESEEEFSNADNECIEYNRNSESSEEDWDSDEYWVPHYINHLGAPQSPWLSFVYHKMAGGSFCPMDVHPVSIFEKVKYEKLCYPQVEKEVEGQFDDYSSDES
ncbi:leucine-rich repeat protein soc-2-like isoform X2 [Aricia agestis]|uniref:leucine-rich repeat protein soc-2-like isoform X2 n=1 Tax=Aricia agestis TaxID=91739 RepID=UPI001C204293|nr:leucine-rich repeat protein soc-2-like isoform X2 [Aricia agestis]